MGAEQEVVILARLAGTRQYLVNAEEISAATKEMGLAADTTGRSFSRTTRHGYLMNQALFTIRRLTYGVTLGLVAGGVAAVKMGMDYNKAMQEATVALRPFFNSNVELNDTLHDLWTIAKYTPFQVKDMTLSFRALYPPLHDIGISAGEVTDTIRAMIDGLSVSGKVTPAALSRATYALQHMAFQGHLTGIAFNQLSRDGINMSAVMRKEFGLTGEQLHQVGKLGIPAIDTMRAIIHFMQTTPGYVGAAQRLAMQSWTGQWSTFKDNVSQIMGNIEKGLFNRMQDRITAFNMFFNRLQSNMAHGGGIETVMKTIDEAITPGNHGVLRFWHEFESVWRRFWGTFGNVIRDITHAPAFWLALYTALVLVNNILVPIEYTTRHFGAALNILIPLYIAWKVYTKSMVFWLGLQAGAEVATTKATKDLTFAQFLLAIMMGRYELMLKIGTAMTWLYVYAQTALAATMLRMQVTAATTAVIMDLAFGPAGWVALGITALTILYFKWDRFQNLVNTTAGFVSRNWKDIGLSWIPVIGWMIIAYRHLDDIYSLAKRIVSPFKRLGNWAGNLYHGAMHGIPHFQHGGTMPYAGRAWVGESGPELLTVPAGARITPGNQVRSIFNGPEAWMGRSRSEPIVIQFMVGRQKLEEVVVDIMQDRLAHR